MLLPNLLVPGAAKSATSTLHELLNQHPQIFMSRTKEPHFFSNDENFHRNYIARKDKLEQYAQLFADGGNCIYRGESSTGYMVFPEVVERIQKTIPNVRFIFILRNPIDRAYSHYWWIRGVGFEKRTFREAIIADMDESPDPNRRVQNFGGYAYYYAFGQYATYLKPFVRTFGKNRILVITTEQLRKNLQQTMDKCFVFLQVSPFSSIAPIHVNATKVLQHPEVHRTVATLGSKSALTRWLRNNLPEHLIKRLVSGRAAIASYFGGKTTWEYSPLPAEDRLWLANLYQKEVEMLRKITGLSFSEWQGDFPE